MTTHEFKQEEENLARIMVKTFNQEIHKFQAEKDRENRNAYRSLKVFIFGYIAHEFQWSKTIESWAIRHLIDTFKEIEIEEEV